MEIQIKLSKEQFKSLMELIVLGNCITYEEWVSKRELKKYEELTQFLLKYTVENKLKNIAIYDKEDDKYYFSSAIEKKIAKYVNEFEDKLFWLELISRLADRDCIEKYGESELKKMSFDEWVEKRKPFLKKYLEEFWKRGIKNLRIKE